MVVRPITLAGFERTFTDDADPWRTFVDRDEGRKRAAIVRALGPGRWGRVLELAAGNGSNSVALAAHALRLDATEGTAAGTTLTRKALAGVAHASVSELTVPGRFPRPVYDAIVIAELLYYLSPRDMATLARDVRAALRPGGRLVLAQHRIDFHDFAQHARDIHPRFVAATGARWIERSVDRTARWRVESYMRAAPGR